jgi:hypothetical protein
VPGRVVAQGPFRLGERGWESVCRAAADRGGTCRQLLVEQHDHLLPSLYGQVMVAHGRQDGYHVQTPMAGYRGRALEPHSLRSRAL